MAEHPNAARIKNVYAAFARGDLAARREQCHDQGAGPGGAVSSIR
jgi:hypothetical protein